MMSRLALGAIALALLAPLTACSGEKDPAPAEPTAFMSAEAPAVPSQLAPPPPTTVEQTGAQPLPSDAVVPTMAPAAVGAAGKVSCPDFAKAPQPERYALITKFEAADGSPVSEDDLKLLDQTLTKLCGLKKYQGTTAWQVSRLSPDQMSKDLKGTEVPPEKAAPTS